MDFSKIILTVLNEALSDELTVKEWLFELDGSGTIKNISPNLNEVQAAFNKKYVGGFPDKEDLIKLFNGWTKCWSRTSATPFLEYGMYFPIIEFIAQLANLTAEKDSVKKFNAAKIHKDQFKKVVEAFKKTIDKVPTINPIDFPTVTAEGQYVATQIKKQKVRSYVAQENLAKYQGLSIKDTIFYMLEARKKARLATVKNKTVPDQGKAVYDVLLNPNKYSGGDQAFSTKVSSDKVYTRPVYEEILQLGLAARRYFDYEVNRVFAEESGGSSMEDATVLEKPNKSVTAYDTFLNNSSMQGTLFSFSKGDGTAMLATDVGDGGYIIKNIKAQTAKNDAAQEFYELLENFANYIREGEIIDWIQVMSGATQVANALSFGAPTVGGKR